MLECLTLAFGYGILVPNDLKPTGRSGWSTPGKSKPERFEHGRFPVNQALVRSQRSRFSLELIRDLRCLGHVFSGDKQELIFGSRYTILPVGPVLVTFVERLRGIFGWPFDD